MVLALVSDLFFSERIRETARQRGVACEVLRDPAELAGKVRELAPAVLIIDMNMKSGDAPAAVRGLKADPATRGVPVVGFLFDAHEELMIAAEEAGCDKVLSRGQLTRLLPDLVLGKL